MIKIPQPNEEGWGRIADGTTAYPSLFNFKESKALNSQQIDLISSVPRIARINGRKDSPASYEEAHRQFAAWTAETHSVMGLAPKFIRIRSARDVVLIEEWTKQLLDLSAQPHEYLRTFVATLETFREWGPGKFQIRYVLNEKTATSTLAKIASSQQGWGQQEAASIHSFNPENSQAKSTTLKALKAAGIDPGTFTPTDILLIESIAADGARSTGFITSKYKAAVQAIVNAA